MLNRAADTVGDVQIGRDSPAGLSDLVRVGNPAGVDGRTARPNSRAQRLGQCDDGRKAFRSAYAAPARDNDTRVVEADFALAFHRKADRFSGDLIFTEYRGDCGYLAGLARGCLWHRESARPRRNDYGRFLYDDVR